MTAPMRHTAVVFDRQPLWLEAVSSLLDRVSVDLAARTSDLAEVVGLVEVYEPDLLIVGMRSVDDTQACCGLLREVTRNSGLRAIVIGAADDEDAVDALFDAGAAAYCKSTADVTDVVTAIRQSFEPSIYLAPGPNHPRSSSKGANGGLTTRESEILRLVSDGLSNGELARMLWVTEPTVKFHLTNIYRKLGVKNRTEASRWAYRHAHVGDEPRPTDEPAHAAE